MQRSGQLWTYVSLMPVRVQLCQSITLQVCEECEVPNPASFPLLFYAALDPICKCVQALMQGSVCVGNADADRKSSHRSASLLMYVHHNIQQFSD